VNSTSKKTFAVLNQMVADGVIENYAVAGAMFLSQDAVEVNALEEVISRHGLSEKWLEYKKR
jgi:hypothetical protein